MRGFHKGRACQLLDLRLRKRRLRPINPGQISMHWKARRLELVAQSTNLGVGSSSLFGCANYRVDRQRFSGFPILSRRPSTETFPHYPHKRSQIALTPVSPGAQPMMGEPSPRPIRWMTASWSQRSFRSVRLSGRAWPRGDWPLRAKRVWEVDFTLAGRCSSSRSARSVEGARIQLAEGCSGQIHDGSNRPAEPTLWAQPSVVLRGRQGGPARAMLIDLTASPASRLGAFWLSDDTGDIPSGSFLWGLRRFRLSYEMAAKPNKRHRAVAQRGRA
jgi:hypothetical protein